MQSSLLFESLFKRNAADSGNAVFLKQLAEEHPYFSPAQFFLLQQTDTNDEGYTKQAAKTNTLFNNPYWLNFQLLREQQPAEITDTTPVAEERTDIVENKIEEPQQNVPETFYATIPEQEEKISIAENTIEQPQQNEPVPQYPVNNIVENTVEAAPAIIVEEKTNALNQVNGNEEQLIFQPLYTSDYFASQGIKLSEEVQANDKLGKQLKSFTDWLKTMKKIAPDKIQIDHNHTSQNDSAIQTLAEKSNTDGEVLTETMADIFIQQGKAQKAIETYEKLSLLNPDKSAYFASKIEHLKEQ